VVSLLGKNLAPMCYPARMDQGSANEKTRHHYIPITYLNNFADSAGKVFAYRKDDPQTVLPVRPDAIAFEKYYYSQPSLDGGRDNNTFENFFGTIESTWNPLVARLRLGSAGTTNFTSSEFENLFTFPESYEGAGPCGPRYGRGNVG
jgi:hypothetical protein